MFNMTDEAGDDAKVICAPTGDPRLEHLRDVHHLDKYYRPEIQHFFEVYKALEPGKHVEGHSWARRDEAEREIDASFERARAQGGPAPRRVYRRVVGSEIILVPGGKLGQLHVTESTRPPSSGTWTGPHTGIPEPDNVSGGLGAAPASPGETPANCEWLR